MQCHLAPRPHARACLLPFSLEWKVERARHCGHSWWRCLHPEAKPFEKMNPYAITYQVSTAVWAALRPPADGFASANRRRATRSNSCVGRNRRLQRPLEYFFLTGWLAG